MLFALGFVFMFTIGGLFNHLVLPFKDHYMLESSINYATRNLLIPVKMYNFEQSASNPQTFL